MIWSINFSFKNIDKQQHIKNLIATSVPDTHQYRKKILIGKNKYLKVFLRKLI